MKHKSLSILLAVLMSMAASVNPLCAAQPDGGGGLSLYTRSESEAVSYSMDEIRKITFNNKGVQVWVTDWPTEYSYSQFRVIALNDESDATRIEGITAKTGAAKAGVYYDLQGRKTDSPRKGIYIMRQADGTLRKIMVR